MIRIGIDVGGTFTDVVLLNEESGQIWSVKVPTTPANRVVGAMEGFKRILELSARRAQDIGFIGHGTTMATNMVVEHKGARTALVTTAGFRDVHIERVLFPPWTTDWITERGHERLKAYGIAPPGPSTTAECPQCGSTETEEVSRFGATPCKAQWRCKSCAEPFERFKCH